VYVYAKVMMSCWSVYLSIYLVIYKAGAQERLILTSAPTG